MSHQGSTAAKLAMDRLSSAYDSSYQEIQAGGRGFAVGGQFGFRPAVSLSLAVSAGWGVKRRLPR